MTDHTRDDAKLQDWIVLGHVVSYGPMSEEEARGLAAAVPHALALSLEAAQSQIETCAKYGLTYKPRPA